MRTYPNCKINLGLRVIRKRLDGYHDLATVFLPVPLCDELIINLLPHSQGECHFSQSGIAIDCPVEDNICYKAYMLLYAAFPHMPSVEMHLVKNIPFGAGLGGGSSDAAFALRTLNDICSLGLSQQHLCAYAARLGADCAFFINNMPAYAEGIGDRLSPLDFNPIQGLKLVLAKPSDTVSTREAYAGIQLHPEAAEGPNLPHLLHQPIAHWRNTIINDFESTVFPTHPAISQLKDECYQQGALYASMSGSGATVFGLFPADANPNIPHQIFQGIIN